MVGYDAGHVLAVRRGVIARGGHLGGEEWRRVVLGDVLVRLRSPPFSRDIGFDGITVDGFPPPYNSRRQRAGVTESPCGGCGRAVRKVSLMQRYAMVYLVHCVLGL